MGKLATKPAVRYRVGNEDNTSRAVGWINQQYGINVNDIGNLSKEKVRAYAERAKDMKLQAEWAKEVMAMFETMIQHQNEIEQFRAEAIAKGLKGKERVDGYVLNAILATHGHETHIQEMFQKMTQGKTLINAKARSNLSLGRESFEQKIREIAEKYRHESRAIGDAGQAAIGDLGRNARTAKIQAQKRKGLLSSLRAEDYDPVESAGGRQRSWFSSSWFSNWFA